jgi:hypothetical protein
VPAAQERHAAEDVLAVLGLYVPAAHGVHDGWPLPLYVPAAQERHAAEDVLEVLGL